MDPLFAHQLQLHLAEPVSFQSVEENSLTDKIAIGQSARGFLQHPASTAHLSFRVAALRKPWSEDRLPTN